MDPRTSTRNPKQEYNFGELDGTARANEPGVYYHQQADKFIETAAQLNPDGTVRLIDGKASYFRETGLIQADAFVQMGYRLASDEEVKRYRSTKQDQAEAKEPTKK